MPCDSALFQTCSGHTQCLNDSRCGPCPWGFISANDFVQSSFRACQTYAPAIIALNSIALGASTLGLGVLAALLMPFRRRRELTAMPRIDALFFVSLAVFLVACLICAAWRVADVTRAVGVDVLETITFVVWLSACTTAFALFLARVKGAVARFVGPLDSSGSSTMLLTLFFVLQIPLCLSLILSLVTDDALKSTWAIVLAFSASLIAGTYVIQIRAVVELLRRAGYRSQPGASAKLPVFNLVVSSVYFLSFAVVVVDLVIACTPQLMPALFGIANSVFMASFALFWLAYLIRAELAQAKRKENAPSQHSTGRSTERVFVGSLMYMPTTWARHENKLSTVEEEEEEARSNRGGDTSNHGEEQMALG